MEREIEELRRQRDHAQSEVDELRKKLKEDHQVSIFLYLHILLSLFITAALNFIAGYISTASGVSFAF